MWIGFRLVLALLGFVIRRISRKRKLDKEFGGLPYWASVSRNKGSVTGFSLGMPRRSPTWVRLHPESTVDRWVKRFGFAKEFQTGDRRFDGLVYVTCDHPFVEKTLSQSAELRRAICDVLEEGYQKIEFDGTSVVIDRESEADPTEHDLELLARLHAASEVLEADVPSRFADPFLWKALVVEGFIWSLFGYSVGAFIQFVFEKESFHVTQRDVFFWGFVLAAGLFVALASTIALVMRGSSRGHRIIVESAFVLFVALPCAGIQIVSDTNRALDFSPPERVSAAVHGCEVRAGTRKGRTRSYTYHLTAELLSPTDRPLVTIQVTQSLCHAAKGNDRAELLIGPGRWSLPWYRKITLGDATWEASL